MTMRLPKTVLITGGAKGIGKAMSEKLASEGWSLILCGRDHAALESFAAELRSKFKVEVTAIAADLSDLGAVEKLFARWPDGKGLPEALICNAGNYGVLGALKDVELAAWKKSFDLNFFSIAQQIQSYLRCAEKAAVAGRRRKILVMSGSGLGGSRVWPGIAAYACAKAALYRLVEVVHEEAYASGIDINCLAPGAVKSGMTVQAEQVGRERLGALYDETLKVLNTGGDSPAFAADAVAMLLSERCDGLSGRLISAKWDKKLLEDVSRVSSDADLLRLRRIDGDLFKKG